MVWGCVGKHGFGLQLPSLQPWSLQNQLEKKELVANGSTKKLVRIADYDKILDISICSLKSVSIWVPRIYSLIYSLGPRQNKTEISHNWMIHPFFHRHLGGKQSSVMNDSFAECPRLQLLCL